MVRFSSLPIRFQLLTLAIFLTLPAMGIILYSGFKERTADYQKTAIESQRLADNLAVAQTQFVQEAHELSNLLAQLPEVKTRNADKSHLILSSIHKINPQYRNILIADAAGTIWVKAENYDPLKKESIADRRYFKHAKATRKFTASELILSITTKNPTIAVAYPLTAPNKDFAGVIVISFDLDNLRAILERSQLPTDANYVLADSNGVIISRGKDPGQFVQTPLDQDLFKQMLDGPDRYTYEFMRKDGDRRITTWRKLRLPGEQTPYMYIRAGISANTAVATANRQLRHNIVLLVPFVLLSFALVLIIGKRSIADRLTKLQTAAQQFASGIYSTRIAHQVDGGEIGDLGVAFDHMAQRVEDTINALKRSEDEVRQLNYDLERKVAERTAQLEMKMQEQESFSYSVSHDLRAPLRHINSYTTMIMEDFPTDLPDQCKAYLQRICTASNHMGDLIDDLLQLSRVGRVEMRRDTVHLSRIAAEIAQMLRETDAARTVDFSIGEGLAVAGDPNLLRMALQNLLVNAWKYTGNVPAARIEFGSQGIDGRQVFYVKDNGVGFDMEYVDKLFGAFQRLHGNEYEGTGIGLATVKRIIQRHDGEIWAESKVNEGATFYFTIP